MVETLNLRELMDCAKGLEQGIISEQNRPTPDQEAISVMRDKFNALAAKLFQDYGIEL